MLISFYLIALVLVLSAFAVVLLPNAIHSALCLIVNLLGVAAMFALLEAHFLATMQVIVYAGAIMVLVVFVLMLLNMKREALGLRQYTLFAFSFLVGSLFLAFIAASSSIQWGDALQYAAGSVGTIERVGRMLFTRYVFAFEAASLLIMAAVVGAVMLSRTKKSQHLSGGAS